MASIIKRFRTKARELQESLEQKHGLAPRTPPPQTLPARARPDPVAAVAYRPPAYEIPESGPANDLLRAANEARALGQLEQAESSYRQALIMNPSLGGALLGLGLVLLDTGRTVDAFEQFRQTHNLQPSRIDPLFFMGVCQVQRGDAKSAIECWLECLQIEPDFVPALERVLPLLMPRDPLEAERVVRAGIARSPTNAGLSYLLGFMLEQLDRIDEAIDAYDTCVELAPDFLNAHQHRCELLNNRGYAERADAACQAFLKAVPNAALPHYEAARVAMLFAKFETAINEADQAAAIDPTDADALFLSGYACLQLLRQQDALDRFAAAKRADPEHARAAWAYALGQIPAIYGSSDDPEEMIANFSRELELLDQWFQGDRVAYGPAVIGSVQAFNLAYQERDNRELLSRYGALCTRLMHEWQEKNGVTVLPRQTEGRIKVGIVSHFVHDHSAWFALTRGWLQQLDRERFEVHLFALERAHGEQTDLASLATSLTQEPLDLSGWCKAIQSKGIEAIIYPDIGLGAMSLLLAALRLAPVQVASWGHPETTGMATIDYYLSADALEPPEADRYYSERLIRLPHLGRRYPRVSIPPALARFHDWRIKTDRPVLVCSGVPSEYAPQNDHVLIEICKKLGVCQLVFFSRGVDNYTSQKLQERLAERFAKAGLDIADFMVTVPQQPHQELHALLEGSTLFLDTIGFSGFNTAMLAIEAALPLVTIEGRFMRGRLASAILRRIGLDRLVANDTDAYVDLVVELARNEALREELQETIRAKRDVLFEDMEPGRALEEFLIRATRSEPSDATDASGVR